VADEPRARHRAERAGDHRGLDQDGNIWTRHIEGALAEMAAAKALDKFYAGAQGTRLGESKPDGGDVGRIQVRCRPADYLDQEKRLIIQPRDRDDEDFLLVVGRHGVYRMVGWINAGLAKRHPEWIANPGNFGDAWFVPQAALEEIRWLEGA
jgi:hypothetical protein